MGHCTHYIFLRESYIVFTSIKAKLSHIKVKLHEASFYIITLFIFGHAYIQGFHCREKKPGAIGIFYYYFKILTLIMISRGSSNILVS